MAPTGCRLRSVLRAQARGLFPPVTRMASVLLAGLLPLRTCVACRSRLRGSGFLVATAAHYEHYGPVKSRFMSMLGFVVVLLGWSTAHGQ